MEPDGIWNGSKMKERRISTSAITGKTPPVCSIQTGHGGHLGQCLLVHIRTGIGPGGRGLSTRRRCLAQSQLVERPDDAGQQGDDDEDQGKVLAIDLILSDVENGEEGLLRHVHTAEGLHALLAFFLLVQQLLLPADTSPP